MFVNLPKLSIAAKLYAIFALMATMTIALSAVAVQSARQHAALTGDFESANAGSWNVERANGLIYAMMMETRGIYLAQDRAAAAKYADALLTANDRIDVALSAWQVTVQNSDAAEFSRFTVRISDFQKFAPELARIAKDSGPQATREWAEKNKPTEFRDALSRDLQKLSQLYTDRARRIYTLIDEGIDRTAMLLTALAALAVMLAVAGATLISRNVAKPIADITRITEAVAAGDASIAVPFSDRRDEIGALARSIAVF
jgi:methyl-accepting chemotaxis protein